MRHPQTDEIMNELRDRLIDTYSDRIDNSRNTIHAQTPHLPNMIIQRHHNWNI